MSVKTHEQAFKNEIMALKIVQTIELKQLTHLRGLLDFQGFSEQRVVSINRMIKDLEGKISDADRKVMELIAEETKITLELKGGAEREASAKVGDGFPACEYCGYRARNALAQHTHEISCNTANAFVNLDNFVVRDPNKTPRHTVSAPGNSAFSSLASIASASINFKYKASASRRIYKKRPSLKKAITPCAGCGYLSSTGAGQNAHIRFCMGLGRIRCLNCGHMSTNFKEKIEHDKSCDYENRDTVGENVVVFSDDENVHEEEFHDEHVDEDSYDEGDVQGDEFHNEHEDEDSYDEEDEEVVDIDGLHFYSYEKPKNTSHIEVPDIGS